MIVGRCCFPPIGCNPGNMVRSKNKSERITHTVVLMQSYSALAVSAHAPVVVKSFFAAQHPSMVASSGVQRLTAAAAEWSEIHGTITINPLYALFFGRTLSFWMCMLVAWRGRVLDRRNGVLQDNVSHLPQQEQRGFAFFLFIPLTF